MLFTDNIQSGAAVVSTITSYTCFCILFIVFHVIIFVAILYMNYPRYGVEIVHFQQVL